jgi:hypothetical protein
MDFLEVEPLLFRNAAGDLLAFREGSSGRITHFFMSQGGFPAAFERMSWREDMRVQVPLLIALGGVFISAITLWPLAAAGAALVRRGRKSPRQTPPLPRSNALFIGAWALLAVTFVGGVDAMIGNSSYRLQLVYGMTPPMVALLWLGILLAATVPLLLYFAAQAWQRRRGSLATRLYVALLALASVAFVAFLANWNLLGFKY